MSKEVETGLLFCWHESQGGVRPDYFPAVRLLPLLHRNRGCTAEFTSAVRCIKCGTVFEGCTDWLLLLYGAFNYCTDFEEGTAFFIAVRSAINCTEIEEKGTACWCCTDCLLLARIPRRSTAKYCCSCELIWHRRRKGCWLFC